MIRVKGHEFEEFVVKDSFNRRATQFRNNIIKTLQQLGLTEDQVDVPMEQFGLKKAPAKAIWFIDGHRLHYSYDSGKNFVENLYVVSKVIELEVNDLLNDKKPFEEFINDFAEEEDVDKERKEARKTLGLDESTKDLELINKTYKTMAREAHPDMPGGDAERFKKINTAHKILKRELE